MSEIVVTEGFEFRDSSRREVERLKSQSMTRVMEVYNYALPIDSQLAERRAWHI